MSSLNCYSTVVGSFVCFGGTDWWYHNRAHLDKQLARRFARIAPTLYVNSIVMQKPRLSEGPRLLTKVVRKTKSIFKGLRKTEAGFWVYSPFTLPVHHVSGARSLNEAILRSQLKMVTRRLGILTPVIWVACPAACDTALKMEKSKLVYQRTDYYEVFPNVERKVIEQYDRKLKRSADLTIFVNRKLYTEEADQCKQPLFLDHGVDFELFATAEQRTCIPADIAAIPHPVVGYFGEFNGHTVDIQLIERMADLLPQMSFVFVGNVSSDCPALRARANVWLLGQKPYPKVPHYGKCFDVAIMPWRHSRWIEACNPIKLKEYLALGKPVVSTPFSELNSYKDVVYVADTAEEFANVIEKALNENNSALIAQRREQVAGASWDGKAQLVLGRLFPNIDKG